MAIADTSTALLYYVAETTWGSTPTSPKLRELRFTGESLNANIGTVVSNEIRSDRQIPDLIQTSSEAGGDINIELSFDAYHDLFEGALLNSWSSGYGRYATISGTIVASPAGFSGADGFSNGVPADAVIYVRGFSLSGANGPFDVTAVGSGFIDTRTAVASAGSNAATHMDVIGFWSSSIFATDSGLGASGAFVFTGHGLISGQWIAVDGFTGSGVANNGKFYKVTTIGSGFLGLTGNTMEPFDNGDPVRILNSRVLKNGTTRKQFTLQKIFTGNANHYFTFRGSMINNMNLTFERAAIATGSFGFLCKSGERSGAQIAGVTTEAAPENEVMNGVANVGQVIEGGGVSGTDAKIMSLSIALTNNLRTQQAIGNLPNVGIGLGRVNVTGSFNVYFEDGDLYDKFVENLATSLSFKITDGAGNSYVISMPRIKISSSNIVAGGIDQDIMAEFNYQAIASTDGTDCTLQIDRIPRFSL